MHLTREGAGVRVPVLAFFSLFWVIHRDSKTAETVNMNTMTTEQREAFEAYWAGSITAALKDKPTATAPAIRNSIDAPTMWGTEAS